MSDKRSAGSPLAALSQAFFGQFFSSESVTSDIQLRQAIVWVLAFLLTPGLLLMIQVFPHYQYIFIRAAVLHAPGMVEDMLDWLAFVFVTYWPTRFELAMQGRPTALVGLAGALIAAIGLLEIVGRRRGLMWTVEPREEDEGPLSQVTVLNIGVLEVGRPG